MSVKARVQSTLAATRLSETPILEANNPTPPVKTAVGISYGVLSDQITKMSVSAQTNGGVVVSSDVQKLLDSLYAAPRLNQWHDMNGFEFRLYTENDGVYVSVAQDRIFLTKGIREFNVFQGMAATALFNTIRQAQELIQPAITQPVMTDAEQEEFFSSDDMNGADIDSALADAPVHESVVEDPEIDDEGLIGEVHQATSPSFAEEEVARVTSYTERANQKNAKIDGVQCSYCGNLNTQAYRGPCPQCPKKAKSEPQVRVETYSGTYVLAVLKSLQGQVLNVVEAAIADKEQRKAVKTLINKTFRSKMNGFAGLSDDEE